MANKYDLRKLQMMCAELGKPVPEDAPKKVAPKKVSKPKKVEKAE